MEIWTEMGFFFFSKKKQKKKPQKNPPKNKTFLFKSPSDVPVK